MNILVVHEVSYRTKVVYEYQEFAELLASRGHNVHVIDFEEHGSIRPTSEYVSRTGLADVIVTTIPCSNIPIAKYITAKANYPSLLEKVLEEEKIKVVLLYSVFINGTSTIKVCKKKNIPVVYRVLDAYHKMRKNPIISNILKQNEKFIYRNADKISVTNFAMSRYVDDLTGEHRDDITTILHHGVREHEFCPQKRNEEIADELNIQPHDRVAVFVGTLFLFCGLDTVIQNMKIIKETVPNAKIIIVGDGEMRETLTQVVKQSSFHESIHMVGRKNYHEIPKYLSVANCAINPFHINDVTRNIVPIKILQYLSCGLPLVSSPLSEVQRLFPREQSGASYVDIKNGESFASAIAEALKDNEESRKRSLLARQIILDQFTMADTIRNLEDTLQNATSGKL